MSDVRTFDFTRNLLAGESAFQNDRWQHTIANFEQTGFNDRVGIEFAVDRQICRRKSFVPFQGFTGLFVDVMKNYLGQENPNYGRPFVQARSRRASILPTSSPCLATSRACSWAAPTSPFSRLPATPRRPAAISPAAWARSTRSTSSVRARAAARGAYVIESVRSLIAAPLFNEALPGHLPPDRASQQRLPALRKRLQAIAALH